jgi:hypothetical protein
MQLNITTMFSILALSLNAVAAPIPDGMLLLIGQKLKLYEEYVNAMVLILG